MSLRHSFTVLLSSLLLCTSATAQEERPRAREAGVVVGIFDTGTNNAITDVDGVLVGHETLIRGDDIRTGVTAIIPAPGNLYTHPIPAWVHVGNGYGKLIGETQIREFGEIETPILLTCTLCVWSAANALKEWMYEQPGMGEHTLNPVVGETNDARVNNMWADPVQRDAVYAALTNARSGPVAEGSVGAGTGTQAFGWKGGIGTSSRVLPESLGGVYRGCSGADELWRPYDHQRRPGRPGAGLLSLPRIRSAHRRRGPGRWFHHAGGSDRCTAQPP